MKLIIYIFTAVLTLFQCSAQEVSFDLFFDLGKHSVTKSHQNIINSKLSALDTTVRYDFTIKGYTDFVDTEAFNLTLSENRAEAVASKIQKEHPYLIHSLVKEGKGEVATTLPKDEKTGIKAHRRVTITAIPRDNKPRAVTYKRNIYAVKQNDLKVGEKYAVGRIHFETGRVKLVKSSRKEVERLFRFLRNNRNVHVEIQGHVCCRGNTIEDATNADTGTKTLSVDRARIIYKYLISRGIDAARLTYKGYAFSAPLYYPEKGKRDRSANRRVEIMITKL